MATINWPLTLPVEVLSEGYEEELPTNVIRDKYEVGPVGLRRMTSGQPYAVSFQMLMTDTEWATLLAFCDDTLISRSLAFGFPTTGIGPTASPTDEWLVRFLEPPRRQFVARQRTGLVTQYDLWLVAIKFEVLP